MRLDDPSILSYDRQHQELGGVEISIRHPEKKNAGDNLTGSIS